jgi:hypothetical protein
VTLSTRLELALRMTAKGVCKECGETAPPALTRAGLCYECKCRREGRPVVERHHVLGRGSPLTVDLPANIHRQLSARAECRPAILKRRCENPLIDIARIVTAVAEIAETGADFVRRHDLPEWLATVADIAAALCRRAADNLLIAAARVADRAGSDWYRGAEFLPWA